MKTPTKKQKLEWIKNARIRHCEVASRGETACTCLAFKYEGRAWYVETTETAKADGLHLTHMDFMCEGEFYASCAPRNNARMMWLAMLETLVEAGEI